MRTTILTAAALMLACAPADEQSAPNPLDAFAGSWMLTAVNSANDSTLISYELTATATTEGWTSTLPDREPSAVRVVLVDGDSVVSEVGPFESALRPGVMVSTRTVARVRGDSLVGTITAIYSGAGPDSLLLGRVSGTRKKP